MEATQSVQGLGPNADNVWGGNGIVLLVTAPLTTTNIGTRRVEPTNVYLNNI